MRHGHDPAAAAALRDDKRLHQRWTALQRVVGVFRATLKWHLSNCRLAFTVRPRENIGGTVPNKRARIGKLDSCIESMLVILGNEEKVHGGQ
jgi:hypothetical protein